MLGCKQSFGFNRVNRRLKIFFIRVYLNPLSLYLLAILDVSILDILDILDMSILDTMSCPIFLTLGAFFYWLCRVGILYSVMKTLSGFVEVYSNILSFPELFSPFLSLLDALKKDNLLPEGLMTLITEVHQFIAEKVSEHETSRQPLRLRMSKPTPIKTFNPQFEEK